MPYLLPPLAAALALCAAASAAAGDHYLTVVTLTLPVSAGRPHETRTELHREFITASTASVCQAHADKRADEMRRQHAATVKRLNASVAGACLRQQIAP